MKGYEHTRDQLRKDGQLYACLDAVQLVRHAFALRTAVNRIPEYSSLTPILFYVYAEPEFWPKSGMPVNEKDKIMHRAEIERFASEVARDEVQFIACSYTDVFEALERGQGFQNQSARRSCYRAVRALIGAGVCSLDRTQNRTMGWVSVTQSIAGLIATPLECRLVGLGELTGALFEVANNFHQV